LPLHGLRSVVDVVACDSDTGAGAAGTLLTVRISYSHCRRVRRILLSTLAIVRFSVLGGASLSTELSWENLEQVARVLGERWARRLRAGVGVGTTRVGSWPGTIEQARHLLDTELGGELPDEGVESLISILERSARAAWHEPRVHAGAVPSPSDQSRLSSPESASRPTRNGRAAAALVKTAPLKSRQRGKRNATGKA